MGWGGGGGGVRVDVNEELKFLRKFSKEKFVIFCHGRCEQRSEVFVNIQKKKHIFFFGGGRGVVGLEGPGWWGVGGQGGCERNVGGRG